jgi:hypothetical protein
MSLFGSIHSTLRADFSEFVSSVSNGTKSAANHVKQQTISSLDKLDKAGEAALLTEAEEEAIFRMTLPEVYTTPLEVKSAPAKDTSDLCDFHEEDEEEEDEEKEDPEDKDIREFLESFEVNEKTDEITELLEEFEDTLKVHFEELVPLHVPYEEFWQRHFYRCDPVRIERAWAMEEARQKKAHQKTVESVKKAIGKPVAVLSSPLKAAIRTLSGTLESKTRDLEETQSVLVCTRQEIDDLQLAITASNDRIASLATKLDEARKRLAATEREAQELKIELDASKTALKVREEQAECSDEQVSELSKASSTETNTQGSSESNNSEEDLSEQVAQEHAERESCKEEELQAKVTEKEAGNIDNNKVSDDDEEDMSEQPLSPVVKEKEIVNTKDDDDIERDDEEEDGSPTSVAGKLRIDKSSIFKLATVGLFGSSATIDEGEVSDGWGDDDEGGW